MVMTVIRVATPMVSPSMVSEVRILLARNALTHWARLSRTASMAQKTLVLLDYQRSRRGSGKAFSTQHSAVSFFLKSRAEREIYVCNDSAWAIHKVSPLSFRG